MKMRKLAVFACLVSAVALCAMPASFAASSNATALGPRTDDAVGVRVVVTPMTTAPGTAWEFELVMDTHTKPLNDDLTQAARLVDDAGRQYVPLAWRGDPPGGHHRNGILRFPPPTDKFKTVELQLSSIGGSGKRVFRWELK